jgi:nicotinamide-nucleotide amidase
MLERHGAVSAEVAEAMARGARERFGTSYGVSATGIAGPTGGTLDKPVGLVYVALASESGVTVERHVFAGDRADNKLRTSQVALDLVRRAILDLSGT